MSGADSARLRAERRENKLWAAFERTGWYHSFELPDGSRIEGANPLERLRERFERFGLPADLAGRSVLDIGAWDGWFTFEAERRGAEVTAVDCVEVDHFLELHQRLGSGAVYRRLDVLELDRAGLGRFDFVLFLGVLYHVKHPLRALEIVCGLTRETAVIETFVTDGATYDTDDPRLPWMEFYETNELGGQLDNWVGPSVSCLLALCRAAGFCRVELFHLEPNFASVRCHRHWLPPAAAAGQAPELLSVVNAKNYGRNVSIHRDDYLGLWFRSAEETLIPADVFVEVAGRGVPAIAVARDDGGPWVAKTRVPPALDPGWHPVRVRLAGSGFSRELAIAVDVPETAPNLAITSVSDGRTWEAGAMRTAEAPVLTAWIDGLPEHADTQNVRAWLNRILLRVLWVGPAAEGGVRQVNFAPRGAAPAGRYCLRVSFGDAEAEFAPVDVLPG